MSDEQGANAQQITYWNEVSGPKWVALADVINDQIEPLGVECLDRASIRSGESVLDVGCGCGQTSIEIGRRVGDAGRVVGVDVSGPMLGDARTRAQRAGVGQVDFVQADAQTHAFPDGGFDLVFSRFGVMFFDDPVAAFANLRRALSPTGRLAFLCWQAITANPWMLWPAQAVAEHVTLQPPSDPHAPGPFAFADPARVRGLLEAAGFLDVRVDALEGDLVVGRGLALDQIVELMQQMGPAGAALREAGDEVRAAASRSVRAILEPHFREDHVVLPFASWIVQGRP